MELEIESIGLHGKLFNLKNIASQYISSNLFSQMLIKFRIPIMLSQDFLQPVSVIEIDYYFQGFGKTIL